MSNVYNPADRRLFLSLVGHAVRARKRARIAALTLQISEMNHQESVFYHFSAMASRVGKRLGTPPTPV